MPIGETWLFRVLRFGSEPAKPTHNYLKLAAIVSILLCEAINYRWGAARCRKCVSRYRFMALTYMRIYTKASNIRKSLTFLGVRQRMCRIIFIVLYVNSRIDSKLILSHNYVSLDFQPYRYRKVKLILKPFKEKCNLIIRFSSLSTRSAFRIFMEKEDSKIRYILTYIRCFKSLESLHTVLSILSIHSKIPFRINKIKFQCDIRMLDI